MEGLAHLPHDLLVRIFTPLPLSTLCRLVSTSRALHDAIEGALRARAALVPETLPADYSSWIELLVWQERAADLACPPVAAGAHHWLMLDSDGRLHTCGSEEEEDCAGGIHFSSPGLLGLGERGRGARTTREPLPVPALAGVTITWISAGEQHNLACSAAGVAFAFGSGAEGRLGMGDVLPRAVPTRIDAIKERIVAVAAGSCHSLFLCANGSLYACGAGWWGRLGLGDERARLLPERVALGDGEKAAAISAGADHSLALSRSGDVFAWGHTLHGQLGLETRRRAQLVPRRLDVLTQRISAISAGGMHSLFLCAGGTVLACGSNRFGQLGLGHWEGSPSPAPMCGISDAVSVCAGAEHSLVVLGDGSLHAVGRGAIGALGLGGKGNENVPRRVSMLRSVHVSYAAAGVGLSLAIGDRGCGEALVHNQVFLWGIGGREQALAVQQGLPQQFYPNFVRIAGP